MDIKSLIQNIFEHDHIPDIKGMSPLAVAECLVATDTFDDTKFQKDNVRHGACERCTRGSAYCK